MDIENDYYHGLAGPFVSTSVKENVEISLSQLESIIRYGGLFSKKNRNHLNIDVKGKPVLNSDDYISVCVKHPEDSEYNGLNEGINNTYNTYVKNRLAIVINKSIDESSDFRKGNFDKFPGERQIKDVISITDFKAIRVGYEHPALNEYVCEQVKLILDKYGFEIPILNMNNEIVIQKSR